jgi:hypothetical protein
MRRATSAPTWSSPCDDRAEQNFLPGDRIQATRSTCSNVEATTYGIERPTCAARVEISGSSFALLPISTISAGAATSMQRGRSMRLDGSTRRPRWSACVRAGEVGRCPPPATSAGPARIPNRPQAIGRRGANPGFIHGIRLDRRRKSPARKRPNRFLRDGERCGTCRRSRACKLLGAMATRWAAARAFLQVQRSEQLRQFPHNHPGLASPILQACLQSHHVLSAADRSSDGELRTRQLAIDRRQGSGRSGWTASVDRRRCTFLSSSTCTCQLPAGLAFV